MDKDYYVACGVLQPVIYAGHYDKLTHEPDMNDKCDVTRLAITAVRDYMVDTMPKGQTSQGFSWKRKDGKKVTLVCMIE